MARGASHQLRLVRSCANFHKRRRITLWSSPFRRGVKDPLLPFYPARTTRICMSFIQLHHKSIQHCEIVYKCSILAIYMNLLSDLQGKQCLTIVPSLMHVTFIYHQFTGDLFPDPSFTLLNHRHPPLIQLAGTSCHFYVPCVFSPPFSFSDEISELSLKPRLQH